MGQHHKQQRRQKRRPKTRRPPRRPSAPGASDHSGFTKPREVDLERLVIAAATSRVGLDRQWAVDQLRSFGGDGVRAVQHQLERHVAEVLTLGYDPPDLLHVVDRRLDHTHTAIASDVLARRTNTTAEGRPVRLDTLAQGVDLLGLVMRLPEVPPTGTRSGVGANRGLDGALLTKVRGLLRKAESTEFDAEAEALTEKAQQLITRHAIDKALLEGHARDVTVSARRIHLHDPYLTAKAELAMAVAGANRCFSVFDKSSGWCTVFGNDSDLDATELLAGSLLAQALGAMARLGSVRDDEGRVRTRSFRSAFLRGFASRIRQRLEVAGQRVAAEADRRALPVLASRLDAAREVAEAAFPHLRTIRHRTVTNGEGWFAGVGAANLASLNFTADELADTG